MTSHTIRSRGTRSRRSIALLTWTGLIIAAAVLWYARLNGTVRSVASETVVLMLSAFAVFSSIFAWMLFSPNRRSDTESAALFFSGAATLLPPCIIAFCLMPPDSVLRGWLTFGVFVLTVLAVMTPVPEEFFAVPRERSTYLRPISESLFASLEVLEHPGGFGHLQTASATVTQQALPRELEAEWLRKAGDPWVDPFRGTGIEPTRPGSRTSGSRSTGSGSEHRRTVSDRELDSPAPLPNAPRTAGDSTDRTTTTHRSPAASALPSRPVPQRPAGHRTTSQRPATAFGFRAPQVRTTQELPAAQHIVPIAEANHITSGKAAPSQTIESAVAPNSELRVMTPPVVSDNEETLTFERIEDEFGGVMVEGTVKVNFEAGQKRANVHIPFSPPLPGVPEVECESVSDDVLRLKVPVRQTYGIRIEARRSDASLPLETEIGFAAVYSAPQPS